MVQPPLKLSFIRLIMGDLVTLSTRVHSLYPFIMNLYRGIMIMSKIGIIPTVYQLAIATMIRIAKA